MINIKIKNNIEESLQSESQFRNRLIKYLSKGIFNVIKDDYKKIKRKKVILFDKESIRNDFSDIPIVQNIGDVYIFIHPTSDKFASHGGYCDNKEGCIENYTDKQYDLSRGDITYHLEPDEIFEKNLKLNLELIHSSINSVITHEVDHFLFDFQEEDSFKNYRADRELLYSMPKRIYEKFLYFMSDEEVRAYVEQYMSKAKKERKPFHEVLYEGFFKFNIKPFFGRTKRFADISNLIMYKLMKYAISKYSSVMDNHDANRYYSELENYIEQNNLQKYLELKKDEDAKMSDITTENLNSKFKNWMLDGVISEASVGQLIASHGIPKSFAKHVKSKCSNGNSDFILKVFMKNYKEMIENMTSESATDRNKMLSDNYITEFNRFMGYVGKTLDEYLKHHKGKKHKQEILELCEAGWPKFLKKMREYKKESLHEVRLNKTWKKRVKERAKRHGREISPDDKKWAKKRIQDWNKQSNDLEEAYLNEIEAAMEASKASKLYLEKLKALRKEKLQANKAMVKPTPDNLSKRQKPGHRPTASERRPNQKIKGKGFAAAGETLGPVTLEELELQEETTNE